MRRPTSTQLADWIAVLDEHVLMLRKIAGGAVVIVDEPTKDAAQLANLASWLEYVHDDRPVRLEETRSSRIEASRPPLKSALSAAQRRRPPP
jgi:hypothetical protein